MLKIIAVIFIAVPASAFAVRSEWERRQLKAEFYTVRRKRNDGADKDQSKKLRLAFISDVHDYFCFSGSFEKLISMINEQHPDMVLLGGDILTLKKHSKKKPDTGDAVRLARQLAARYTVIYGMGNHELRFRELFPDEFNKFADELKALGVILLDDDKALFDGMAVYGADPEREFYLGILPFIGRKTEMPEKYLIGRLGMSEAAGDRFKILLMHSPLYLEESAKWGADLVLSGHFHGGTIRLPDGRGLMSPQYQFFNKECSGVHHTGDTVMIVNRGLGTHTFNIRINDLPELSIIDIE
ncbi:MAG: metallophosphoesterase [Eubacteriales bacterium]|nr:metallophosphoesterase [Eubacteriales bacterium]